MCCGSLEVRQTTHPLPSPTQDLFQAPLSLSNCWRPLGKVFRDDYGPLSSEVSVNSTSSYVSTNCPPQIIISPIQLNPRPGTSQRGGPQKPSFLFHLVAKDTTVTSQSVFFLLAAEMEGSCQSCPLDVCNSILLPSACLLSSSVPMGECLLFDNRLHGPDWAVSRLTH